MAELIRKPGVENNFAEAGAANVRRIESIGIPKAGGGHEVPVNIVNAEQHEQTQPQVTAELQSPENAAASNAQDRLRNIFGSAFNIVYSTAVTVVSRIANSAREPVRSLWEALLLKANTTSNPPASVAA